MIDGLEKVPTFTLSNVDNGIDTTGVTVRVFGDAVFILNEKGETLANLEVTTLHGEDHLRVFISNGRYDSEDFDEYVIPTTYGAP